MNLVQLRALKGTPITLMFFMWLLMVQTKKRSFTIRELAAFSGYNRDTVADVLRNIEMLSSPAPLVRCQHGLWSITDDLEQLFIVNPSAESLRTSNDGSIKNILETGENTIMSAENLRIAEALAACGVGEPKRSYLASFPHINCAFIEAHRLALKKDGKGGNIGLLIHKLENNHPLPIDSYSQLDSYSQPLLAVDAVDLDDLPAPAPIEYLENADFSALLSELKIQVSSSTFSTWFSGLRFAGVDGDVMRVFCPASLYLGLAGRYLNVMERSLTGITRKRLSKILFIQE